jgi:hypothetical protein
VPVLLLFALVALFGLHDQTEAQAYAAHLGRWVGPIGGAIMTFLAALWVARGAPPFELRHGIVLGVFAALLDVGLLLASGAAFEWIFAASNTGRVVAGTLGGAVAGRRESAVDGR